MMLLDGMGRKILAAIAIAVLIALNLHDLLTAHATTLSSPSASISGYIWNDDNGDTVRDEIEKGMAGVTVDLYLDDSCLDTRTTAENGSYWFGDLSAGDYIVQVTDTAGVLSDYALTTDNNPLSVHLEDGEVYSGADFGYEAVAYPAPPTAITLSSFAARSSAGLEAFLVWPWLVGVATLVLGGVLWIRWQANIPGRARGNPN
jgi:hypothetical protein